MATGTFISGAMVMSTEIRKAGIAFFCLLFVQLVGIWSGFSEKYESRAVLQIQPAVPLDQFYICNVETIRSLLERWDLDAEVRKRFGLDKDPGSTQQLLISKRFQEADPNTNMFSFRFRHKSPDIAQGVIAAFLDGIEKRWREGAEKRFKSVLAGELVSLERNLVLMESQLKALPESRTVSASPTSPVLAQMFSGAILSYPNPEFDALTKDRNLTIRRMQEVRQLLSGPLPENHTPLRWLVIATPTRPERPVWPTNLDLAFLALINSLIWSAGVFIWYKLRPPASDDTTLKTGA